MSLDGRAGQKHYIHKMLEERKALAETQYLLVHSRGEFRDRTPMKRPNVSSALMDSRATHRDATRCRDVLH